MANLNVHDVAPRQRFLLICPVYPPAPAGEAEHCFQIAERLAGAGHHVSVLTSRTDGPARQGNFVLDATMPHWGWLQLPRLAAALRRHRPDGVVLIFTSWLYEHHPMVTFLPGLLKNVCPGAKLLTILETAYAEAASSFGARLGRKLAAAAAGGHAVDYELGTLLSGSHMVAALGPTVLDYFIERHPALRSRALVIPPPPLVAPARDTSERARQAARAELGVENDELLLAYFGFVYPGKGVDVLVRAVAQLVAWGRPVRLVMAGGGRDAKATALAGRHAEYELGMQALARELGVGEKIIWPAGYESEGDEQVGRQLLAADLAALPFDDGAELRRSSIAVVAAAGLPLVTTRPSAAEPAFTDRHNVLLCPPRDPHALAAAIAAIADDATLRDELRRGSLALAESHFSWRRAISAMVDALSSEGRS